MRFGLIRRISKEDLQREEKTPKWLDALLGPINEFLDNATIALRGNLTFRSNMASSVIEIDLTHNTAQSVNPQRTGKFLGVLAVWAENNEIIVGCGSQALANGNIEVTVKFATGSGTYRTKLIILYDED